MKAVKRYRLHVIKQVSNRDVMYNMISIITAAICYKSKVLRASPKHSHHKEKVDFLLCL